MEKKFGHTLFLFECPGCSIPGGKLKIEQGVTNGKIKLDGDPKKFEEFVSLLDTFDPWYQVVMPIGTK